VLKSAAAATALPWVHIRTAGAAGKLNLGIWDHWVPAGNDVLKKQAADWGEKNKVEVKLDLITSVGNKLVLTQNAEQQARTGHDVLHFGSWTVGNAAAALEPVDDVVNQLIGQYGKTNPIYEYMGKPDGKWRAVPVSWGSQNKGPCARISTMRDVAGIDLVKMYPAENVRTELAKTWTMEAHLKAAEACAKADMHFAVGLGTTADSVDTIGAIFASFGAELVDAKGNIQLKSDAVAQALEYCTRLAKFLPADTISYDDASNNKAFIAGKTAMIWNPPSAWAVAKRDAPAIAADTWHFPSPSGPKGRFIPFSAQFWGIWNFAPNKSAAKDFIMAMSAPDLVRARVEAVEGYDLPPFASMLNGFKIWDEVGPPKGTVYNYPVREVHDATQFTSGFPAPHEIGVRIYQRGTVTNMVARMHRGQPMREVLSWAQNEIEGFMR
jgi:ABC-type glycerol-3-phosphate transport system substrate-binding protein